MSTLMPNSWLAIQGPVISSAGTTSSSCSEEADSDWREEVTREYKELPELRHGGEWKVEKQEHQTGEKQLSFSPFLILVQERLLSFPGAKPSTFSYKAGHR